MRRIGLTLGLALAFVAAVVVGSSVSASAQIVGVPLTYSFLSVGSTHTIACNNALAQMNASCIFHGSVTYVHGPCRVTPTPFGEVTICECTAKTSLCVRPFQF